MISVRLPEAIEHQLDQATKITRKSKSEIIKESLLLYFGRELSGKSAYELGQKYFGKYASGRADKSVNHSQILKQRIAASHHASRAH